MDGGAVDICNEYAIGNDGTGDRESVDVHENLSMGGLSRSTRGLRGILLLSCLPRRA